MDHITCEFIDRAITLEMRPGAGLPRGVTHQLYEAARAAQDDKPLTWLAAKALKDALSSGDHVLVITGFGWAPNLPAGETDGPPGAAAVARALDLALGAKPVLISEPHNIAAVTASCEGIGLAEAAPEDFARRGGVMIARPMPVDPREGAEFVGRIFDEFSPRAVVVLEKGGPAASGDFHTLQGMKVPAEGICHAHLLIEEATRRGILTVGVGDGGNEIGFGKIERDIHRIQPHGPKVATVVATDVLVAAAVSNWGGYGIAAALAGLCGDPDILHSEADEIRMLERCIAAGAMDGICLRQLPIVDGISTGVQTAIITFLREIVGNSLKTLRRDF